MLLLFTAVFLGFDINENNLLSAVMTFMQFLPAVIEFLSTHAIPALAGIIIVLILTILSGRIYCSFLCPLGAVSDFFIFISGGRNKKFQFRKAVSFIRPFMILLVVVSLASHSMIIVNIFDPYSYFGRIAADLIKPAALFLNNSISSLLLTFKIYFISQKINHTVSFMLAGFTFISLVLIIAFAVLRGRLYCNTLCPVGAILGFVSKFSLFKIKLDDSKCTSCGKCEKACKAECISASENKIDYSRCVMCFNCKDVCSSDAVQIRHVIPAQAGIHFAGKFSGFKNYLKSLSCYFILLIIKPLKTIIHAVFVIPANAGIHYLKKYYRKRINNLIKPGSNSLDYEFIKPSLDRKSFISKTGFIAFTAGLYQVIPLRILFANSGKNRKSSLPVSPPGSISISRFTSHCTACHLCVSRCPGGVLQPAFLEYGLSGIFQPLMDYKKGFCEYECKICLDVCPNSAIMPVSLEKKKRIKIGNSVLVKEDCVVYKNNKECGACIEVCPTRSVYPVIWNGIIAPELEDKACIGCGACERACPVAEKAIYIDSLPVHAAAEPRKEKSADLKKDKDKMPQGKSKPSDDFPF
jgi:polyferredoxin